MRTLARLLWQLLHWPGVFALFILGAMFLVQANGSDPSRDNVINALVCSLVLIGGRVLAITGLRNLRLLPNGHQLLVRALAILTLCAALMLGGLAAWIGMGYFTDEPRANIALAFVALSGLSFLFFARDLHGRAQLYAVLGMLSMTAMILAALPRLPEAWSWFAMAGCVVLWALALRTGDRPRARLAAAFDVHDDRESTWLARLQTGALLARAPAATILNANRGMFARPTDAVAVTLTWAVVIYFIAGLQRPGDSIVDATTLIACAAAALMLGQSWVTPARARPLWLLSGASRAGIFKLAEKMLIVNLILLGVIAWLAASGLAWLHDIPVGGGETLLTLAGLLAGGLAPIYFGLLLPTLNHAWQRIPVATLAAITVVLGPAIWIGLVIPDAVDGAEFTHSALALVLVVSCLLLRAIAIQRWKSIDWTRVRNESALPPH